MQPMVMSEAWCVGCGKDLDKGHMCPDCRSKARQKRIAEIGIRPRFKEASFDNLHEPRPSAKTLKICKTFCTEALTSTSGEGLYLWGPRGSGKTHLVSAIATEIGLGLFVGWLNLLDTLRESVANNTPTNLLRHAVNAPVLYLDDLGAERMTEWVQERLYFLISNRYDDMLPTVITSNLSPEKLAASTPEPIYSRILGTCKVVKIDSPDHRLLRRP